MSFRKLWSACGMQVPQACLPSEKKTRLKHHSYCFHHSGFPQNLKRICIKSFKKNKPTILCCYLARVICKLHQNSWDAKYSQNVTCICKNTLSVNHILLECPITTELFHKNAYDFNACNTVTNILYNTNHMMLLN